jgi:hypothetical protein
MHFVETLVCFKEIRRRLDDDSYRKLQVALLLRPEQGRIVKESGGLRKLRWALPGAGKSGGLRLIYYWSPEESTFYMLYLYSKNEQGDLTRAQIRILRRAVEEEFK